jgi:signal transduction histidine kinase
VICAVAVSAEAASAPRRASRQSIWAKLRVLGDSRKTVCVGGCVAHQEYFARVLVCKPGPAERLAQPCEASPSESATSNCRNEQRFCPFAESTGSSGGIATQTPVLVSECCVRLPLKSRRGWLLYASAWLPYAASYFLIFRLQRSSYDQALLYAVLNVIPAALLGISVFWFAGRLHWPARRPVLLIAAHCFGAVLFAVLWWASVQLLMSLQMLIVLHLWRFNPWGMYAAQWQAFSGLMVYGTLIGFSYMVEAQERAQHEENLRMEAEALRVRSDLSALRSQLNPHFLFNTLNSVIALVGSNPDKAEQALLSLSSMLRYALGSRREIEEAEVTFAEELLFTDAYLALEKLRLGDRLQIERSIDPAALTLALPSLTLQPLVENAIRHSISVRPEGGTLAIRARAHSGGLHIDVWDDGDGFSPEQLTQSTGLGLKTVKRRVELYYENLASMSVNSASGSGTTISLRLPQDEALELKS